MGVVSKVAACVPIYDFLTAQTYAMWMLHLQVIVCAFGALSFAFTGVLQITFGFTILALVSLEVGSMKLAKMYCVSLWGMILVDIVWLALWATRINVSKDMIFFDEVAEASTQIQPSRNDYSTCPKFLLGMMCILFIMRPFQILIWSKMWDLNFGDLPISNNYPPTDTPKDYPAQAPAQAGGAVVAAPAVAAAAPAQPAAAAYESPYKSPYAGGEATSQPASPYAARAADQV